MAVSVLAAVIAALPAAAPRLLYGGYSMEPGDWQRIQGVFNLVHHSLLNRPAAEARVVLDKAATHGIQILLSVNSAYDPARGRFNSELMRSFLVEFSDHPALHGYLIEAAYKIAPERQMEIYRALKTLDPRRPVWIEFSSTQLETWRRFDQNACDVLLSYNYPYEERDTADMTSRIDYSTAAIKAVVTRDIPVVPLLQAFGGGRWRRPCEGEIMRQYTRWRRCARVVGVGFYRWRARHPFVGLGNRGMEQCTEEAFALCRMLARLEVPFVDLPLSVSDGYRQ